MTRSTLRIAGFGALALGACLAAPGAGAETRLTVERLREMCDSSEPQRQSSCAAYVAGVRHTLDVFKTTLKQRVNYCIPAKLTTREIRDAFVLWAGTNPAAARQPAVAGIIRMVHEAYPCRKGEKFEF